MRHMGDTRYVRTGTMGHPGGREFCAELHGACDPSGAGAELAALATSSAEKAAGFQAFAPRLALYESYDALLADPDIDAVYIPLPNHLHMEWSLKALEAGKHVLCEKPMTMVAEEFDTLIAKRDATGLLAAEAYMIVHHPQWQLVRKLVAKGAIGRLVHVEGRFSYMNRDAQNIRNRPDVGGGALRDIGVYVFGAARFVSGEEPDELSARIRWDNGVDAFSEVQARFPSFMYSAYVSMRMHPYQEMLFHGEDGVLRLTAPFNARVYGEARVELHKSGLAAETRRFPSDNHYELQVEAFGRSVRDGVDYPVPLEFSRGTQVMIDQALARAETL